MTVNFAELSTIDHMTHIANLNGILANGLLSHNNPFKKVDISNPEVNQIRKGYEPVYNRKIHDYVPFYFNPRNAMLYRNQRHFEKGVIIILGFDKRIISTPGALYTNGNAARRDTRFSNDKNFLENLNWKKVFSDRWCSYGCVNDDVKTTMMSELLVHDEVGLEQLQVIYCQTHQAKQYIMQNCNVGRIRVVVEPQVFF